MLYLSKKSYTYFYLSNNQIKSSSGPVAILVLTNKTETYVDPNGITTLYNPPYVRWKELIGNKEPSVAKTSNPQSLRAIYGLDLIKNEFWGSDSASDAYRELSNFMFPLPAKVKFKYFIYEKLNSRLCLFLILTSFLWKPL